MILLNSFLSKYSTYLILFLIILLGFGVRVYKIDQSPPSLNWDEASVGYNAWSVANYGQDEWGKHLPIYFKAFEDDKHPIHLYITAIFIKAFGLSDFTVRLPSAVFGVFCIFGIFFLMQELFLSQVCALFAALLLAISPLNIHFSRFNHELNFVFFFFILGLIFFLRSFRKKREIILSLLFFGIDLLVYPTAIVIGIPFMILLWLLYIPELRRNLWNLFLAAFIYIVFIIIIFLNPQLYGSARASQTGFSKEIIERTSIYKSTKNTTLARIEIALNQYPLHFNYDFLFGTGDKNPRLSDRVVGEFYILDLVGIILGLLFLLKAFSRKTILLLSLFLLSPLPSALTSEAPHASRSMFMCLSVVLISALGFGKLIDSLRAHSFKWIAGILIVLCYGYLFSSYQFQYYSSYPKRYGLDWQYGMKQVTSFISSNPQYGLVHMTDVRDQPYIFFLYYLKVKPELFLRTVEYNRTNQRGASLVTFFDKYYFERVDLMTLKPQTQALYILSPSEYDGLRYKSEFKLLETVKYPDKADAFFLLTAK